MLAYAYKPSTNFYSPPSHIVAPEYPLVPWALDARSILTDTVRPGTLGPLEVLKLTPVVVDLVQGVAQDMVLVAR